MIRRALALTIDPRTAALARLALAAVFLFAGVTKALTPHGFADDIANYQLVPAALIPSLAAALPFMEMLAGLALLAGVWTRGAALLVLSMLVVFLAALLSAFARGIDLACGCFGGKAPADLGTVARDVALMAAACLVLLRDQGRARLWPRRA